MERSIPALIVTDGDFVFRNVYEQASTLEGSDHAAVHHQRRDLARRGRS